MSVIPCKRCRRKPWDCSCGRAKHPPFDTHRDGSPYSARERYEAMTRPYYLDNT